MLLGANSASCIFATRPLTVELLMLASGVSPRFGLSHLSTQFCQDCIVAGLTGLRFLFIEWFKNRLACSRNVVPTDASMNACGSLTPLAATISFARLRRSPFGRAPSPERGQILSLA